MIHKGKENGNMPRVQIEVSKNLKKLLDKYTAENGTTIKHIVTNLLQRFLAGEVKL